MPTLQSKTLKRKIVPMTRLLDQGQAVADLHQALASLKFEVGEREVKERRFGRMTKQAVIAFQEQQNLQPTGQVDEATANRLNEVLTRQGFLPAKSRPFRDPGTLNFKLRETGRLDEDARDFVQQRLNAELKEAILRQFESPSEALQTAIRAMDLDYEAVIAEPLHVVLIDHVAPALLDMPELEEEVEKQAERGFPPGGETVSELLLLDSDIRRHPLLREEARRAKNAAIGRITELTAKQVEAIEDLDLDVAETETWEHLVATGVLTERKREDLENTVELAKLTDDKFEVVEALRAERLRSPRDLITLDKAGWQDFLARHQISPPESDDLETYATLLDQNVQRAFRTPYLMNRLVERRQDEVLNRTADLEPLLARNEVVFVASGINEDLDWGEISGDERLRLETSLRAVNRFANTYSRLGIAGIFNDASLSPHEKQRAIRAKQSLLQTFHRNNPDLDLEWVNVFNLNSRLGRAFQPRWENISEEDRPQLRQTLMAFQRTQRLTENFDESEALLASGLDSAFAILNIPEAEFARRVNLGEAAALRIYRKASDTAVFTGHALSIIEESTTHAPLLPNVLKLSADSPNLEIINVLKDIDGYQDLFGSQNYCRCKHCHSIFGPAAYFVDLMDFIDNHVSRPVFVEPDKTDHPLYLKNRRGDLWALVLSCKNTDTKVPYLTIVNEVLERYLERVFEEDDIYEALTQARLSFHQPFNLPFEELRLYLTHFGVSLTDLYEMFSRPEADVARVRLGCSPEEFRTIFMPAPEDIELRFGNPENILGMDAQQVIRHVGVSREELDRLLGLDVIKGILTIEIEAESPDDLVGFSETVRFRQATDGLLVLLEPEVRRLLDRLHRVVRLWRKLPWTPEELQLMLVSLLGDDLVSTADDASHISFLTGLTPFGETVVSIADLRFLQDALAVSVEDLCALIREIPTVPVKPDTPAMFTRLFGGVDSLNVAHPALGNTDPENPAVSPDFGILQGVLRLSETEVVDLISTLIPAAVVQTAVLERPQLSRLYRHARTARALGLSNRELLDAQSLLGLHGLGLSANTALQGLLTLTRFKQRLDKTPFSFNEVHRLIIGEGAIGDAAGADLNTLLNAVRNDPDRLFNAERLAQADGITLTDAETLLARLSRPDLAWVAPQQSGSADAAAKQTFSLAPAYGLTPDFDTLATLFQDEGNESMQALVQEKATAIQDLLNVHHPQKIFVNHLTQQFNINNDYLKALSPLLSTNLSDDDFVSLLFALSLPGDESDAGPVSRLVEELRRLLFLFQEKADFSEASLIFVTNHPELFELSLPPEFTFASLRWLSFYSALRPKAGEDLEEFHEALLSWTGATFAQPHIAFIATLLKAGAPQLQSLLLSLSLDSNALEALASLKITVRTAQKLGLDGAAMKQLTATNYAGLRAAKSLVYGAIRAKYEEDAWLELIEPYVDKVNEIKRDALVDRILSKEFQLKFKDARELYQFFLLDVEMDGCARTSRVLEAISACQLYAHRCRMNLEQSESGDAHVLPDSIPEDQWLWRKNYRVWEANRKVFLYPENWLEPDLRDNKTPIFKQVESDLLQSTITADAIEKIYRNYLREYAELSKLIVVSAFYDDNEDAYVFFARTPGRPFQYYWRKLLRNVEWTPWWKIELEIEPPVVSAHKHQGKLYLFWTRVLTNNDKGLGQVNKSYIEDDQTVYLEYSFVESNGRWTTPQRVAFHNIKIIKIENALAATFDIPSADWGDSQGANSPGLSKRRKETTRYYEKIYADTAPNDEQIRAFHFFSLDNNPLVVTASLNEYANKLDRKSLFWTPNIPLIPFYSWTDVLKVRPMGGGLDVIVVSTKNEADFFGEVAYEDSLYKSTPPESLFELLPVTNVFPKSLKAKMNIVHNRTGDSLFSIGNQQFFIRRTGGAGYKKELHSLLEAIIAYANRKRDTIRLSTTLADKLGEVLFNQGLERFLSLQTQGFIEAPIHGVNFEWIAELPPPMDTGTQGHLNFAGAQGPYFEELFFHLPFLIAHYLNASQKFAAADYWYRRIFDPTASENPEPQNRTDRNWRYIEFRNRRVPKMHEILTDEDAIERYKEDPFNPFAIARLRILAFQKAVVMKYVDNLLDWGDHLFAQDTFESINEAMMLYIMAADILGDRPREAGDCETTTEFLLTYQNIISHQRSGSEFLIELENLQVVIMYLNIEALQLLGGQEEDEEPDNISAGFVALRSRNVNLKSYSQIKTITEQPSPVTATLAPQYKVAAKASAATATHRSLAFCIPPNDNLLGYWDRVQDRLFKIRNCMNLQGVRRELALFQPPIEPGLLVKAKAAGLSLEEALGLLTAEAPLYRFAYLLDKAKQFAATIQSFGASLLSALEKKDAEELTLLRAVHEQELLKTIRQAKEDSITEATHHKSALEQSKELATQRQTYYTNLLAQPTDPALAISKNEQDSLDKQEEAKDNQDKAAKRERGASGINAAPFIGFTFNPFEIKIPFNPLGESPLRSQMAPVTLSYSTANVASALSADSIKFQTESNFKNVESNRAATRGGHERRKQEWEHQLELARQEENQFDKQILAADLRIQLAQKDLAAHDKQIDHSAEVHEFYQGKFTNLGLYTYLATSLSRLHREAYNLAHEMAMKSRRAYQFETDDQTFFITNENWEADKAGFLAGERLMLQLQRMEKAYLDQNRREYEITLPFSLARINPRALIDLRETGRCNFSVPEIWFDLYYPGQYKRRMKSARLTIPCVTGPYANVSAKLTLTGSRIRPEAQLNSEQIGVPHQQNTSVATSTANNDSGVFELNFRDERYVPFEGAGAVSDWLLELPFVFRPFDYDTISDVILHLSYTAKDDGRFRNDVENDIGRRLEELGAEAGFVRWFSMRREFGSALHRLQHPPEGASPVAEIAVDRRHFPHFLRNQSLTATRAVLIIKPKEGEAFDSSSLEVTLNGIDGSAFAAIPDLNSLPASEFTLNLAIQTEGGSPWELVISNGALDPERVADVYLLITYTVATS